MHTCALLVTVALLAAAEPVDADRAFATSYAKEVSGDLVGSLADLAAPLRALPGDYLLNLRSGWLLYRLGRHAESIERYQAACNARTRSVESRLGLALPLLALGRWNQLEQQMRLLLRRDPGQATAERWLAEALLAQQRTREAGEVAERLAERHPTDPNVVELLARVRTARGDRERAIEAYRLLLLLDPANLAAAQALATDASGR
jgi:tetratricopeptide (TPR) repeat protein